MIKCQLETTKLFYLSGIFWTLLVWRVRYTDVDESQTWAVELFKLWLKDMDILFRESGYWSTCSIEFTVVVKSSNTNILYHLIPYRWPTVCDAHFLVLTMCPIALAPLTIWLNMAPTKLLQMTVNKIYYHINICHTCNNLKVAVKLIANWCIGSY